MKIDYKSYIVYPYTMYYLKKYFSGEVLNTFGEQLALLYQNGFSLSVYSLKEVDEQLRQFNYLKEWEDLDHLIKICDPSKKPTKVGYKIVDSILEVVIKQSSWAAKEYINVKRIGDIYHDSMVKMLSMIGILFESSDLEIQKVVKKMLPQEAFELADDCLELSEENKNNILLIKYQKLFDYIVEAHKHINKLLLNTSSKGRLAIVGNINDEIYGSSGYYLPNTNELKFVNGSAVYELKTLCDKNIKDEDLKYKMLVIAKESVENGEKNKSILEFVKGAQVDLSEIRKLAKEIVLSGIMALLSLKHGITLIEGDSLNKERAERISLELDAICKKVEYEA